jgi:L-iditol 2-dehydrogenase
MVFYGPGDLRPEDLPVPRPAQGELVMHIDAALTCGTDVKTLRRGHPVMIPKVPTVFGHEFAGTVASVGPGVSGFREGDRVVAANSAPCAGCYSCRVGRPNLCEDLLFVNGAYGEFILLPPRLVARNVVPLAASLPAERAAFAEPLACALLAIERVKIEAGQTVVVFGHGPLGCLLGMLAASRNARVVMVGKSGWRFDRLKNLGFARWLDATSTDNVAQAIRDVTNGRGAEVTVDATGRPEVWEHAVDAVVRGGSVLFFGGCTPGTTISLDTRKTHYEELALFGAFHHTPETIRRAVETLTSGALVPDSLISHRMPLEEVGQALALMAKGEALKVSIRS